MIEPVKKQNISGSQSKPLPPKLDGNVPIGNCAQAISQEGPTQITSSNALGKYRGCLLGLAVGDALGTTLEFSHPGTFEPIKDIVGGGPFELEAGQWTDDTSMALCLADSLIQCKGFNPQDQLERYLLWYEKGYMSSNGSCFDIGSTTLSALEHFKHIKKWPYCGSPFSAPTNGSIMRLAPVPMYYAKRPLEAIQKAALSSQTTHGSTRSIDACRYLSALIVGALNNASKEQLLSDHFSPIEDLWKEEPLTPQIDEIASGSFKYLEPPKICGSGLAMRSLEAALWAFYKSNSFSEGALLAVNLGNDADTTGAVYGQLAGAFYGVEGIPSHWLAKIYNKDLIKSFATKIYEQSCVSKEA